MNLFTKQPEDYKRDLDLYRAYLHDSATFLSIRTGDSYEQCYRAVAKLTSKEGERPVRDPRVIYLSKETPGNRDVKMGTVSQYLKDIQERNCIMSPTMAVYFNPMEKRSLLAEYILLNLAKRSKVKKIMFAAKMSGDQAAERFNDILQTTYKVKNNSLSGAHASPSTPLYNKSSHSTLTSVCRSASGTANACNERFIAGNRHYFNLDITLANIVSIINHSDYPAIERAMDLYKLHWPTDSEVCAAIRYSTDLYWKAEDKFAEIVKLVNNLTPLQRAAYLYTADFWHLKQLNPDFVRNFLGSIVNYPRTPIDKGETYIKKLDGDQFALVGLLCGKVLHGSTIKDVIEENGERLGLIGAAAKHVLEHLELYKPLYDAFWVTPNSPSSLADFPTSIRRSAIVSDTDSTIFTVQDWTVWYRGTLDFSEESNAIAALVVYFSSQLTKHMLAVISGNLGVIPEKIHKISMKNEYMFPVFALTPRAKHYFAYMSAREGNVYLTPDLEIKGVTLKNSKVPKEIMQKAHKLITDLMDSVLQGQEIDLQGVLTYVADIEREIRYSIESGETRYLTTAQVKAPEFYKTPDSSPYADYVLWEEVFADRYGHSDPPPFLAIKASVIADNKTSFKEWIAGIEDRQLADRLTAWAEKYNKNTMTTIRLPSNIATTNGVPKEIVRVIDVRKIIYNTMEAFYLILESLGYYIYTDKAIVNLVSDRH